MTPFSHRIPLLLPTALLALGIVSARWVGWPAGVWAVSLSATIVTLFLCFRSPKAGSLLILLALYELGAWLSSQSETGLQRSLPAQKVCYEGVVMSEPVRKGKVVRFDMAIVSPHGKPLLVKAKLLRDTLTGRYERLHVGDGIRAASYLGEPTNFYRSEFDYARWLRLHGFSAETFILPQDWQKARVRLQPLGWWNRAVLQARKTRQTLLLRYRQWQIGGDEAAIVAAMTLGDKSLLTQTVKDDYSRAGAAHLLALSGLHLGILCGLFSLFSRRRRRGRWLPTLLALVCVWCFAFLTGLSPSVVRAALMLSIYSFARLLGRDHQSVNTLMATVMIMLVARPLLIYDMAFQLSVLSVLSIQLFFPLLTPSPATRQGGWKRRVAHKMWDFAALSIAAQVGTAPLVAYGFGRFPTYFLLSNLVAVPCATVLLYLVVLLFVFSSLPAVQMIVAQGVVGVAKGMNAMLRWVAGLPHATVDNLHPTVLQTVLCYVLLLVIWYFLKRLRAAVERSHKGKE